MNVSDRVILNELRKRNKSVFEALFYEYHQPLLRFAERIVFNRDVCEDLVQSVFIYFWENAKSVDINLSLKAYLYQAVRFKALSHLRNLNIHDKHKVLYLENEIAEMSESEMNDSSELAKKIDQAIQELPPEMAKIFRAKYIEGKINREISEEFDISENTVKTQLQRAKLKLRFQLAKSIFIYFYL